jgi:hypothetical protein
MECGRFLSWLPMMPAVVQARPPSGSEVHWSATVHKISFDWSHAIWTWVARNATM